MVGDRPHCSCLITNVTPTAPKIGSTLFLSCFARCVSRHRLAHPLFWPHRAPVYLGAWARALPAALRPPFCPVKLLPAHRLQAEVECYFPQSLSDSPHQLPGPSAPAVLSLLGEAVVASLSVPTWCPGPGMCLARGRRSHQGEQATMVPGLAVPPWDSEQVTGPFCP